MFGGSGRNGFGIGLAVGIFFTLFFVIWSTETDHAQAPTETFSDQQQNSLSGWELDGAVSTSEDTLAQWVMAIFGVIAAGLSGWAIVLLRATLIETRLANKNAAEGTQAATIAATVAMEERRPWIDLDIEPLGDLNVKDHGVAVSFRISIKNVGHSPAIIRMVGAGNYDGATYNNDSIKDYADEYRKFVQFLSMTHTLFPGQTHIIDYTPSYPCNKLTPISLRENGKRQIAVGATVVYGSRFSKDPHATHRAFDIEAGAEGFYLSSNTNFLAGSWRLHSERRQTYAD